VLASTGLTDPQKLSSLLLVNVYVRGQTQLTLGFEAGPVTGVDAGVRFGQRLLTLTDPRYPRVTAAMNANLRSATRLTSVPTSSTSGCAPYSTGSKH
jgi:hypothetical protein